MNTLIRIVGTLIILNGLLSGAASAEDGYDLWLRYQPLPDTEREILTHNATALITPENPSATTQVAINEMQRAFHGFTGNHLPITSEITQGTILIGTPDSSTAIARLALPFGSIGKEGFLLRSMEINGFKTTVIAANTDLGLLYGTFEFLRQVQTKQDLSLLDIISAPDIQLRVLNHWDNLDRSVERGYAGQSIWDWWRLPTVTEPRYQDYARANASLGINGTVLNNVNAQPEVLLPRYIAKTAALADIFRPYGIRVFLSVRFSSPIEIGGLDTADPLNPEVQQWWKDKADEIYRHIPDFGGFLVKANSEGQPGPQDYDRTHVDGANMLAAALEPHDGTVMWRAFVYSEHNPVDRAKQAYDQFKPLDGDFADNVLVQVKNGAIDFQPREPFHPMFGTMPNTPLMMEFQITQEYLGFSTHLVYLGALYEEVLKADTYVQGKGSTVARVIDGSLHGYKQTGIAGVANIGVDRDWSGSIFNQADWYAFGRLAWNPDLDARDIAEEWLKMTFSTDPEFVQTAADMMMRSREAVVDYMTPLGLAHLMDTGHHYGPGPWVSELARPEWNPVYYHRADSEGIGFDRTPTGSNAVEQYAEPLAQHFSDLDTIDDKDLLWFHHLPWDYQMKSGKTLWNELVSRYDRGIEEVESMQAIWESLRPYVDQQRFERTADLLEVQLEEANWWRNASITYFQNVNGLELPEGIEAPPYSLEHYKSLSFPYAPGI